MLVERLIEIVVVLALIAYVMYRGVKHAEKQKIKYNYIFRPRNIGTNPPGPFNCRSLDDLRKHPMFKHWEDYYNLMQSNTSTTVKMVKQGHHYNEGIVVGWLEEVK